MCRLDSSLTVPGKRRCSSSSSRGGQTVITYSLRIRFLNLLGFSYKSNVLPTCLCMLGMISSSLEQNRPGVRLMSGPGSERCSHTGVISRSSFHCRNSLCDIGLVIKVTAGGQIVHSVLRQRRLSGDLTYGVTCLRGRRCPRMTCCLCPSGASSGLFHGFGDQLGSLPSLSFPAASCFTPSDVGSGSFCYVCLVLIS